MVGRRLVIRIATRRAGRAKYGHGRADLGENFKGIHEFRHDAENAPRILFDETGCLIVHPRILK